MIISEDMYLAYKIIINGYKIKYCADSVVTHSHEFTCKQLFNRYFDTGVFFTDNNFLSNYSSNQSGISLAKSVLFNSVKKKDFSTIGMQLGKKYKKLPKILIRNFSLNKNYWKKAING